MSSLFGGDKPKPAVVEKPKPPPSIAHEEVQAAGDAERRRRRQAAGRASTQLTSGVVSDSSSLGTSALLGA